LNIPPNFGGLALLSTLHCCHTPVELHCLANPLWAIAGNGWDPFWLRMKYFFFLYAPLCPFRRDPVFSENAGCEFRTRGVSVHLSALNLHNVFFFPPVCSRPPFRLSTSCFTLYDRQPEVHARFFPFAAAVWRRFYFPFLLCC